MGKEKRDLMISKNKKVLVKGSEGQASIKHYRKKGGGPKKTEKQEDLSTPPSNSGHCSKKAVSKHLDW